MSNTTKREKAHNRGTPSTHLAVRSSQARAALAVGAFAVYALAYLPLRAQAGIAAGLLSIVPVALAGWAFGLRGGLLAGLANTVLHMILMKLAGYPGWDVVLRETNGLGPVAAIAVGVAAGYWSDLIRALQQQIAERRLVEQALRASQARLASTIDSAMDAIISLDADQRIILFNPAAEQMFRCPAAEAVGQPLDQFIPQRFRDAHREHIREFGQTNWTRRSMGTLGPLTCLRADGEEFPAEISISQIEMAGQKIYTAILRDVTERVRAEGRLRLQSATLEVAANGIVITDRDGIIQWANPAFTTLTGFTTAEAVGKNPRDLIRSGKQDRAFYKNMWDTILAGQVWRGELINRRKDGTLYTEEMTLTPLQDGRGEIIRFIAVKQDISERKRAEQALRESEKKYRALFEQNHDAIFILDFQGRHLDANQRAANMLGYTREELMGISFRDISADITQSEHILERLLRGEHIPLYERMFRKKDGKLIPVEINLELVRDIHGKPVHIQSVIRDITQRKQAEKTLRDSQTRYRMLFEDSPVVLLEEDFSAVKQYVDRLRDSVQDWSSYFESHPDVVQQCATLVRVVDVNQAALVWYQADSKESLLVILSQVLGRGGYPSFGEELLALAQGRTSYEIASSRTNTLGDSLRLIVRGTVAPGYEDSWGRVLVSILDITDRERALEALRASNETLRALIQVSPLAIILLGPEGNVKLWNPAAERMFGWTEQIALGCPHPIVPESKQAEFQAWYTAALQGQVVLTQETLQQRQDGALVNVSLSMAGLRDADGNIGDVVAIMANVTERKQAEEEIKRLNRDLERRAKGLAALNRAGQLMSSILDQNTLLTQVMEQAQQLLDVESASVLLCRGPSDGENAAQSPACPDLVFAAALGPDSDKLIGLRLPGTTGIAGWVMQNQAALIVDDAGQDPHFDNRVDTMRGRTTHSLMAVPLISHGQVLGVIEAVNKLVGRFDAHDLDMLNTLASSAAIAIENARMFTQEMERAAALNHALEQQRELDRLQREFIQNVSHELRTPLALIRGYAEVLESGWMGELNAEQKESIGVIARRSLMLTKLVNDIVTVLAIEQRELIREPFDLVMLVRSVLTGFRPAAEQADLVLSAEIPLHLPLAYGDTIALRRALDNLLNNALKFTPAGGRITVRLYQIEGNLMIEMADTGIGIPHDQLDRIFERFYQVDGSSTRKYGGMGLGLSLVKSIVEGHRGQVTVASTVGVGTTFTLALPLDEI